MEFIQGLLNDKKKKIIFAFVFVILIVAGVFLYKYINSHKTSSSQYEENNEIVSSSSESQGGSKSATLYFFYTTWCPYSLAAIPEWEKIVDKYSENSVNGFNINFIDVDCTKETVEIENMINKYNVEGYPTIKMIKDDQVIEFDAKAKFENIEQFLVTVL
jgi:thiol-disulfide isomerase/thioredoxin|uniref:Thioredoxin domain-containing protein n=1 Tax=viral metagenome TaxID=1070528 RepID=A0A6C0IML2_9ZZZZ